MVEMVVVEKEGRMQRQCRWRLRLASTLASSKNAAHGDGDEDHSADHNHGDDDGDHSDDEKQGTYLSNLGSNNSAFC